VTFILLFKIMVTRDSPTLAAQMRLVVSNSACNSSPPVFYLFRTQIYWQPTFFCLQSNEEDFGIEEMDSALWSNRLVTSPNQWLLEGGPVFYPSHAHHILPPITPCHA
jgi:hypothetical protein